MSMTSVSGHERRLGIISKAVIDNGINLKRPSKGISGYEAAQLRAQKQVEAEERRRAEQMLLSRQREKEILKVMQLAREHYQEPKLPLTPPIIKITVSEIKKTVSAHSGVSINDIDSHRRLADIIKPRHIAMMLAKALTLHSFPEIGRRFGDRDHTTILHAVRKLEPIEQRIRASVEKLDPPAPLEVWVRLAFEYWDEIIELPRSAQNRYPCANDCHE